MQFIDSKVTVSVTEEQKEKIKSELGKAITTLHKTETYLMVGIEDDYDLWMTGKSLIKVRMFQSAVRQRISIGL